MNPSRIRGIRAAELDTMVRLAREQMHADFKKVYDPENKVNHEIGVTALSGGTAIAGVAQAAAASAQSATGAALSQGASGFNPNAGFIVGPTEGGTFGKHHFDEFYKILKLKELYDRDKREADNPSIGTSQAMVRGAKTLLRGVGTALISARMGYAGGVSAGLNSAMGGGQVMTKAMGSFMAAELLNKNETQAADYLRRNPQVAEMGAMATGTYLQYRAVKGYNEGGTTGALAGFAGGAGKALSIFGLDADLNYVNNAYDGDQGFSGRVGVAIKYGDFGFGISSGFTEEGFGGLTANAGIRLGDVNFGLSISEGGGFGFNAGVAMGQGGPVLGTSYDYNAANGGTFGLNLSGNVSGANLTGGVSYNANDGYGGSIGISSALDNPLLGNQVPLSMAASLSASQYGETRFNAGLKATIIAGETPSWLQGLSNFLNVPPPAGNPIPRNKNLGDVLLAASDPRVREMLAALAADQGLITGSPDEEAGFSGAADIGPDAAVSGGTTYDGNTAVFDWAGDGSLYDYQNKKVTTIDQATTTLREMAVMAGKDINWEQARQAIRDTLGLEGYKNSHGLTQEQYDDVLSELNIDVNQIDPAKLAARVQLRYKQYSEQQLAAERAPLSPDEIQTRDSERYEPANLTNAQRLKRAMVVGNIHSMIKDGKSLKEINTEINKFKDLYPEVGSGLQGLAKDAYVMNQMPASLRGKITSINHSGSSMYTRVFYKDGDKNKMFQIAGDQVGMADAGLMSPEALLGVAQLGRIGLKFAWTGIRNQLAKQGAKGVSVNPYAGYTFHPRTAGGSSQSVPKGAIPYRSGRILRRQTTQNTCGHYSCGMAAQSDGYLFDVFKAVKFKGDKPLFGTEIIEVLEHQGIKGATRLYNPTGAPTAEMLRELAASRPTIALINSSGPSGGHWVVVDGAKRIGGNSYYSIRNPWPNGAPEYLQPVSSFLEEFRGSLIKLAN